MRVVAGTVLRWRSDSAGAAGKGPSAGGKREKGERRRQKGQHRRQESVAATNAQDAQHQGMERTIRGCIKDLIPMCLTSREACKPLHSTAPPQTGKSKVSYAQVVTRHLMTPAQRKEIQLTINSRAFYVPSNFPLLALAAASSLKHRCSSIFADPPHLSRLQAPGSPFSLPSSLKFLRPSQKFGFHRGPNPCVDSARTRNTSVNDQGRKSGLDGARERRPGCWTDR